MGIYGYCVVRRAHPLPAGLAGLSAAPVELREVDDLAVLISRIERPDPSVAHVQEHNAVIEAVVTPEVTPVPLRFGQWAGGSEVFDQVVREQAPWYRERLAAFAASMEFGLRVARPGKKEPARDVRELRATTGAEYMQALRERVSAERGVREGVEGVRAGISEVLGDLVREERVEEARTPHGVITVAHLVSRDHFEAYRDRAQRLRERFPELRFLLSGPWVPYSFAA